MDDTTWEAIFMLVVLKIPLVYLAVVVWWAIKAEPARGGAGGGLEEAPVPLTPCGWDDWKRHRTTLRSRRPLRPAGPRARRASARASR